jgi:hypothetical protein
MTKIEIMDQYFNQYGIASSVPELSGKLSKRFPTSKANFNQEARDYINARIEGHKKSIKEEYEEEFRRKHTQLQEGEVRFAWNPKYIRNPFVPHVRDFIVREFRTKAEEIFTCAFSGLKWQPVLSKDNK